MPVDPSQFHLVNVADTCALWNVLSSRLLYSTSSQAGVILCCTSFVHYECLHKHRKSSTAWDGELMHRYAEEHHRQAICSYHLDIADLQEVALLENRKRLSKGELSSIAFAKKTGQAFLTDDQRARKLAAAVLDARRVQTTPHLVGWLVFTRLLFDGDVPEIIREHTALGRPLGEYFDQMYKEGLRCLLASASRQEAASQSG